MRVYFPQGIEVQGCINIKCKNIASGEMLAKSPPGRQKTAIALKVYLALILLINEQ